MPEQYPAAGWRRSIESVPPSAGNESLPMCGLAGVIGDWDPERKRRAVSSMMMSLSRRGPNGGGLEQWSQATLGHRRLSIFDLSAAGRQPMLSSDRQLGVVFNGAIYNFLELRAELEHDGARFRSQTDTEVLLHGYAKWGLDKLIGRLRGMFAIGLWDEQKQRLYLVRDRLGEKPLLYRIEGGVLVFASTARALCSAGMTRDLDPLSLAEFLEFGFVTDERSIYAGVKKVPPGFIAEWDGSELRLRSYWSFPQSEGRRIRTFQSVVDETEEVLREAVRIRLQADVPVGALLSGGIDSSLVCWAMLSTGANIQAFTVSTPSDHADEAAEAVYTARQLGIRHSVIPLSGEDPPGMEDLVSAYGEPFACASALGLLKVSQAIKREVTVLLTGDGGDDIFLGYPYHRHFWMTERVAQVMPEFAPKAWPHLRRFVPDRGFPRKAKHFLDYSIGGLGAVTQVRDGLPLFHRFGLLGGRLARVTLPQRQMSWSNRSARHLLEEFLLYDWKTTLTGEYLTKVDGGTMFHGLEARSPFMDHLLWEYAGALPVQTRLNNGVLKAVLREIARRRISPRVANRRKRGFEIPVCRWLARKWANRFVELFTESLLGREDVIQPERVLWLFREKSQTGTVPVQLWRLFVLENWMRAEFN
jgi:asparagine synthase (glutamine-hydrolysing)